MTINEITRAEVSAFITHLVSYGLKYPYSGVNVPFAMHDFLAKIMRELIEKLNNAQYVLKN
jgi:hypothetical protein